MCPEDILSLSQKVRKIFKFTPGLQNLLDYFFRTPPHPIPRIPAAAVSSGSPMLLGKCHVLGHFIPISFISLIICLNLGWEGAGFISWMLLLQPRCLIPLLSHEDILMNIYWLAIGYLSPHSLTSLWGTHVGRELGDPSAKLNIM